MNDGGYLVDDFCAIWGEKLLAWLGIELTTLGLGSQSGTYDLLATIALFQ